MLFSLDKTVQHGNDPIHIRQPALEAFNRIEYLYKNQKNGGNITGIASGFHDLDDVTSGFQRSDLIIIAGRPSMGKTALAMNVAEHAVIVNQQRVLIFSLEMPAIQLAMRSLSSVSSVDSKSIREGNFGTGAEAEQNWTNVAGALEILSKAPLYIDATPGISPLDIVSRARRIKRDLGGLDLVIVDYLQLMQMKDNVSNRATELANITRELKFLAKDLDIPVIALSQLNREVEQRPNKRPLMADLRESGAIEQDADLILFVYRDEMYKPNTKDKGLAEVNIAKHRNGETKTIRLVFVKQFTRFDNYADSTGYDHISDD